MALMNIMFTQDNCQRNLATLINLDINVIDKI